MGGPANRTFLTMRPMRVPLRFTLAVLISVGALAAGAAVAEMHDSGVAPLAILAGLALGSAENAWPQTTISMKLGNQTPAKRWFMIASVSDFHSLGQFISLPSANPSLSECRSLVGLARSETGLRFRKPVMKADYEQSVSV